MEENNENKEKESISLKNIMDDKMVNQVTLRDLILFKEDILKEMRQFNSKIKQSLSEKFDKFVQDANERLPIDPTDNGSLYMKNLKFIEEKNNILSTVSEKEKFLNEKIMVNDLHINNCQKELNDAIFKYDRAILDNLLIPGLVGKSCKFLNFKDYMVDIQNQINNAFSKLEFNGNNINKNRKNLEERLDKAETKIKNLEYELKQFIFEKNLVLENQMKSEIETLNKNIIELTGEFYKNNVELKNQIESLKKTEKLITEENRKINFNTLNEFEKIKKAYKLMKKSIMDLGKLLMLSDKRTNKNKNFAANKQLIIEQFNNMIMGLMKDVKKENTIIQPKEPQTNPKKEHSKKPVSVIKQYIEGKIQAEDTYGDIEKKERYKNSISRENEDTYSRNLLKRKSFASKNKNEDSNSSRLNNNSNNKVGVSVEKNKKFTRHASVEFRDVNLKNNLANNNNNNNESITKKNSNNNLHYNINNTTLGDANKSHHFPVIKEEKNNISRSDDDSLFADLEEDFKNLNLYDNFYNKKDNENKKYEEENSLFNYETSFNKPNQFNKNKLFLRGVTTNYDNIPHKKSEFINQTPEKFKLLLKAQENLKKKNLEKISFLKKDNEQILDKNYEKRISEKKINYNNQEKITDKKSNFNSDNFSQNNINSFIQDSSRFETKNNNKSNINKIEEVVNNKNNEKKSDNKIFNININDKISEKEEIKNEVNKVINNENKFNTKIIKPENNEIKNNNDLKKKENNNKIMEKQNNLPKEKNQINNYKLKDNFEIQSITQTNSRVKKNVNFINNNFSSTQYRYKNKSPINKGKNLSPKSNRLKLSNIENNKEGVKREINLSAKLNNKKQNIFSKMPAQSNETPAGIPNLKLINKSLNIKKDILTKSNNNFKIRRSFNSFNEDIFVNKDEIKKMNYYKDKDIIDKPLLVNQIDFRVQNSKGTVENKILELEYFTKKKLDELVREIKNFIPIHFNAYVKE